MIFLEFMTLKNAFLCVIALCFLSLELHTKVICTSQPVLAVICVNTCSQNNIVIIFTVATVNNNLLSNIYNIILEAATVHVVNHLI